MNCSQASEREQRGRMNNRTINDAVSFSHSALHYLYDELEYSERENKNQIIGKRQAE